MAAKSLDKILLGAAATLLAASVGWMAYQNSKTSKTPTGAVPTGAAYESIGVDAPKVTTSTWQEAPSQTTGPEWVFDVFTPPEIYYYPDSKKFEVKRAVVVEPPKKEEPFGVKLVQVRPDVFRLQLVGYVGKPGDYRGNFENALSGKTIIGREGKEFPDLGLKVKSFEVKRVETKSTTSMTTIVYEAFAVVVDVKTGDEVTLTNTRRYIQGEPYAIFSPDSSDEQIRRKAGESFEVGSAKYSVVSVTVEPPQAVVRKEAPSLKEPSTQTLAPYVPPAAPEAPPAATPAPQPEPAAGASTFPGFP